MWLFTGWAARLLVEAELGSEMPLSWFPGTGVGLLRLSAAVQAVFPLSLPWPTCVSLQEAADRLVEGSWQPCRGSPCPTCPPRPTFPASGCHRSRAFTFMQFLSCMGTDGPHRAFGPASTALLICSPQGTACSLAAARNPRTSTARQSGKNW